MILFGHFDGDILQFSIQEINIVLTITKIIAAGFLEFHSVTKLPLSFLHSWPCRLSSQLPQRFFSPQFLLKSLPLLPSLFVREALRDDGDLDGVWELCESWRDSALSQVVLSQPLSCGLL